MSDTFDPTAVETLAEAPPDESAAALARLLDGGAGEHDQAATDLLVDRHRGDPILEHLPLSALAALCDRTAAGLATSPAPLRDDLRRRCWALLDVVRRTTVLRAIGSEDAQSEWTDRILRLVDGSHYTFAALFSERAAAYGTRPLFRVPRPEGDHVVTWRQVAGRVDLIARGLLAVTGRDDVPVAVFSRNRLEMALVDLACLSSGIVNVMVPGTSTEVDVAYILDHAGCETVIVGDREQLRVVEAVRERLPRLARVVALDPEAARSRDVLPLEGVLERAGEVPAAQLEARRRDLRIDDLASVMYTSGTTGTPKGIMFSHRNIVSKRFCRALALPEIGENDRFLCYLPLFHTFGRYLEMTGCVFWGATYCFAESPSVEALSRQMRRLETTVFISIPMKWMQLYDLIRQDVDVEADPDEEISRAVRQVTGGGLRWGLSAAGYLDPDIFRFFQRYGVELMSGFGMTEATGGITMTPPGRYRDDSLGGALPGIEIALEDDGELKIRGPYVTVGYLDPPDGTSAFDDDGWLHTGDLMDRDADGFIRIIDRKKEIYKNIQGQTIAPQKIENLFRDFEPVGRIFLVGDHRPYNTALIWPNPDFEDLDMAAMHPDEVKAHFRSLVVSANSFLAPYERIVDFAIIDRDFDAERGELTAKGTYRRKTIERNFADRIRLLYRRTTLHVGNAEVTVPNWFFQALGLTTQELRVDGDQLVLGSSGTRLTIRRHADGQVRVGAVRYRPVRRTIDLGELLATPRLWLGNDELVDFAPLDLAHRDRRRRRDVEVEWVARTVAYHASRDDRLRASTLQQTDRLDPLDLHLVACLLEADDPEDALAAVGILERSVASADATEADAALRLLRRAASAESAQVVRRGFRVLALHERPAAYPQMLASFLDRSIPALDGDTIRQLAESDFTTDQVNAFLAEAERRSLDPTQRRTAAPMLRFIAEYGAVHPGRYHPLRAFLIRMAVVAPDSKVRRLARLASVHLETGFRAWLGTPRRIAVDPETGNEYRWDDVVAFADDVDDEARTRILKALKETPMLREAAFLFTGGSALRLDDILPGGVWVRHLGTEHGKSVYRLAVRARNRDIFDVALNVARELDDASIREEIDWLVVCGATRHLGPLVEDFGGWWPEHRMWTEEFIPGDTLDRGLRKLVRRGGDPERLQGVWPFAAWSALSAFVGFWERTGRTTEIANASPTGVIVPMHDYHTGARLVSIAARRPHESLASLVVDLKRSVVDPIEAEHPELGGLVEWDIVFSALVENVGEDEGLAMLGAAAGDDGGLPRNVADAARRFVEVVQGRGFLSRRLFFAAKRYRRWARLNQDATPHARARTLREMFDTYGLGALQATSPEVRVRFFRETVFREAPPPLADGLEDLIGRLRRCELTPDDLSAAVADLRARLELTGDDDFFLARLSYPYLQPEDRAIFVAAETGGVQQSEMVVTLEDADGRPYRIRHALSPKEVARLHRMFVSAKLPVVFRPEHRFLVAVNDRGHLMGGLFYEVEPTDHTAHMDKVVIAERFQGQGIAAALIEELSNRLRTAGYTSLTTGFFRPEFFYRFGFAVERRYAGLVRRLESLPETAS